MSYELNILVVGQDNHTNIPFNTTIELLNESQDDLRYHDIWGFMTAREGMWYSLGTYNESGFSALRILDADFDIEYEAYPYWINDELKSNLVPMLVRAEYRRDLEEIVQTLITFSPLKTVYVMARMQGGDDEVVCGVLSRQQFWALHDENKILFNVCYILKD